MKHSNKLERNLCYLQQLVVQNLKLLLNKLSLFMSKFQRISEVFARRFEIVKIEV